MFDDRVHLTGHARVVDDQHGLGPRGDRILDERLVDVHRVRTDVHEHGHRAPRDERVRARNERERGHDDLVARLDVGQDGRHLESRRAGMGQQRPVSAGRRLEPLRARPRERPVTGQLTLLVCLRDVGQLATGQERTVEGDRRRHA